MARISELIIWDQDACLVNLSTDCGTCVKKAFGLEWKSGYYEVNKWQFGKPRASKWAEG